MPSPRKTPFQAPADPLIELEIEKGLPCNPEAEAALLGAILLDPIAFDFSSSFLSADDFGIHSHRTIYLAMARLHASQKPIDYTLLVDALTMAGELKIVGGLTFLSTLTDGLPRSSNVRHYAGIIVKQAQLRRTYVACVTAAQSCLTKDFAEGEEHSDEAINSFLTRTVQAVSLAAAETATNPLMHVTEIIPMLNATLGGSRPSGVSTGFDELDDMISCGGWPKSELNFLIARSQHGKTSLMLAMAYAAATAGRFVVIFSLETTKERLLLRLCCQLGSVSVYRALHNMLSKDEMRRILDAQAEIAALPIYIDDSSDLTSLDMAARCRRLKAEKGHVGQVWIDYVQLIVSPQARYGTRNDAVAETNRQLKSLAKELRCPIVGLSQLKRDQGKGDEGPPRMGEMRDSGTYEEQGYLILGLFRQDKAAPKDGSRIETGQAKVEVLKDKDGPCGVVTLGFEGQYTRFSGVEQPRQQEIPR